MQDQLSMAENIFNELSYFFFGDFLDIFYGIIFLFEMRIIQLNVSPEYRGLLR